MIMAMANKCMSDYRRYSNKHSLMIYAYKPFGHDVKYEHTV